MANMTQCEKIMKYMERHGAISQRDALFLGCQRLASRIHDLKREGHVIKTEMRKVKNADGSHSYVAYYFLEEGEKDG